MAQELPVGDRWLFTAAITIPTINISFPPFWQQEEHLGQPREPSPHFGNHWRWQEEGFPQPSMLSLTQTLNKATGLSGSFFRNAHSCCARARQKVSQTRLRHSRLHSRLSHQVSTILAPVLFSGSLTFDEGRSKINSVRGGQSIPSLQYSK